MHLEICGKKYFVLFLPLKCEVKIKKNLIMQPALASVKADLAFNVSHFVLLVGLFSVDRQL